jgi:hypothetical protein
MRTLIPVALISAALILASHRDDWPVRDTETIEKTLQLSGATERVIIDNLDGHVHVTGTSSSTVHIVAHKTIRAETDSDLAKARAEVKLDISQEPDNISVYYDAPWRCNHNDNCRDHDHRYYEVTYDIDAEIPATARLDASTVSGKIEAGNIQAPYTVSSVNGRVEMTAVASSGRVTSVNGPISVAFSKNPTEPCTFKTVNGGVEVFFQPHPDADLFFHTLNGEVLADFDVGPLSIPASTNPDSDGPRFIYRRNHQGGARAGAGGPKLDFETVNGSIRLHSQK